MNMNQTLLPIPLYTFLYIGTQYHKIHGLQLTSTPLPNVNFLNKGITIAQYIF